MAHRKIIELTIKVVIDVDTDDFEGTRNSDQYTAELNEAIDDFVNDMDYEIKDNSYASVKSTELMSWA